MRANEFSEAVNPDILKHGFHREKTIDTKKGPIKLIADVPEKQNEVFPQILVKGFNEQNKQVSYLRLNIRDLEKLTLFFGIRKQPKNAYLVAGNVMVTDEYQKLGIAREMYKFIKDLGNDIKPSETQTDYGKAMWRSFNRNQALAEEL
jgi:hypothetical protein